MMLRARGAKYIFAPPHPRVCHVGRTLVNPLQEMHMQRRWLIAAMLVVLCPFAAQAQDSTHTAKEPSLLRRVLFVQGEGWGGSAVTNVGSFFFNGDYNIFSAGIGFGLSYKARAGAVRKYPLEIGFYVDKQNAASVSGLMHVTFVQAFGAGIGIRFWENGTGVVRPNGNRTFFTLGYGLTNEKQQQ
jgi:hypothetical protein